MRQTLAIGTAVAIVALGGCGSSTSQPSAPAGGSPTSTSTSTSHDNSIQTYGSVVEGTERSAITKAAFSFFAAMAAHDYGTVCTSLAASNRAQLGELLGAKTERGGCEKTLKALLQKAVPEARKAAAGAVSAVRAKGDVAFVLFRPKGGPASYFVLKREGGDWKATSLSPGTPIDPLAH